MRVLHVINIGGYGGAEKLLLQLLPGLNKNLVADCLVCCREGSDESALKIGEELKKNGVTVYYLFYKRIVQKKLLSGIVQVINNGNYELIHSHLKHANLWLAWLKWRKKVKIPVVTTLHGYRDSYQNKYGLLFKKKALFSVYYWTTNLIFKKLDGFILISKCLQDFFKESALLKGKDMRVIYHGYEIPGKGLSSQIRPGTLLDPKIAIPGRMIKMKGHKFAIKVLKILSANRPMATLHIFGNGPEEDDIRGFVNEQQLDNKVFFHGYVHDLLDQLKQCDIALIPSMYESFGLVFLDAFAAGIPVVAFNLPAGNEIITHRYNGLLATPYDQQSLYENVAQLCESEELRRSLISNATSELKESFSIERMVDEYHQYYIYFCTQIK